jgi:transcription antitermination factor NusG
MQSSEESPREHWPWYAIHTRSNFEKAAAQVLVNKGFETYLPLYKVKKRWTDRVVEQDVPLFSGYVFCRMDTGERVPVLSVPGVVSIVGFGKNPAPISDGELDAVRRALESGLAIEALAYLKEGERVRVNKEGALYGVEGILLKKKSDWKLVISVELLHRSVAVEIDRDWVTAA